MGRAVAELEPAAAMRRWVAAVGPDLAGIACAGSPGVPAVLRLRPANNVSSGRVAQRFECLLPAGRVVLVAVTKPARTVARTLAGR
jgi:hypothetical protein